MKRTSFLLKFLLGLMVLLLVSQSLLLVVFAGRIRDDLEATALESLRTSALLLKEWARDDLGELFRGRDLDVVGRVSNRAGYRISLHDAEGRLLQDSHLSPGVFGDPLLESDLIDARDRGEGWATHWSRVMGREMLNYTVAFHDGGPTLGYIRLATPVDGVDRTLEGLFSLFAAVSFGSMAIVFALAALYGREFTRGMESLIRNSSAFARGEAYQRVYLRRPRELRLLSLALNKLYDQLEERIHLVHHQRDELATILTSMVEAVVVLDDRMLVKTMNPAARRLFAPDREPEGRSLIEVFRHSELDSFAHALLTDDEAPVRTEIVLRDLETTLQLQGAALRTDEGRRWGLVLVMIDITQLKRLEVMRRDFVANVSHELKTPITNVLGYVETLLDGALLQDPQRARTFLETIARHAGRLNLIVDDLLILTRLENAPPEEGERRRVDLAELVPAALPLLEEKARARQVTLTVRLPGEPVVTEAYPLLLEQAVVNLVDNAVKFSPPGSPVVIEVFRQDREVGVRVDDGGPGVSEADRTRIFERFYRTDQGRKTPGTGLGLAIVKHILLLHRGSVSVESPVPGASIGSRFTLRWPGSA